MQSVFRRSASLPLYTLYTFLLIHTSPLSGSFSLPLISTEGSIHSDIFLGCLFPSPQGFSCKRLRERFITFASSVANVILGSCKRYPWRTHVFAMSVARTCRSGCTYVQERLQVLASEFGPNRLGGCSALQDGLQCTAGRVALHCGEGCSALRGKCDSFLKWFPIRLVPRCHKHPFAPSSKALCLSSLGEPLFVQSKTDEVSLWKTKRLRCKPHLQRSLSHALSEYVTLRSYRSESYHLQHRDYATSRAPSWPSLEDRRGSTRNLREPHAASDRYRPSPALRSPEYI